MYICLSVFYLSFTYFFFSDVILLSLPLWRNPIGSRSLWSVLGGGKRESPVKHGAGGGQQGGPTRAGGGGGTGGEGPGWARQGTGGQGRARGDLHLIKQKYNFKKYIFSL